MTIMSCFRFYLGVCTKKPAEKASLGSEELSVSFNNYGGLYDWKALTDSSKYKKYSVMCLEVNIEEQTVELFLDGKSERKVKADWISTHPVYFAL